MSEALDFVRKYAEVRRRLYQGRPAIKRPERTIDTFVAEAEAIYGKMPKSRWATIIAEVARHHGLTADDILGPSRKAHVIKARHEAIARVWQACPKLSYPHIGRIFNRDHTTIMNVIEKFGLRGAA